MRPRFRCAKLVPFRRGVGAMSVKDRMQALGGHARSSRQPPLRERRVAGADKSVAADDIIDRNVPANLTARDSTGAPPVRSRSVADDDAAREWRRQRRRRDRFEKRRRRKGRNRAGHRRDRSRRSPMKAWHPCLPRVKTTPPAPRNAPSFTSGKTGRRYIRMSWRIRMSANIFSGICRRKSLIS